MNGVFLLILVLSAYIFTLFGDRNVIGSDI